MEHESHKRIQRVPLEDAGSHARYAGGHARYAGGHARYAGGHAWSRRE